LLRKRGRNDNSIPSSGEEAEASDQSVVASESENEEVTAAAKVSAANKLKQMAEITVDFNSSLLDFTI
jgi:hypothetical protein